MNVLVRPHPYNCHAWPDADMSAHPGVAVFPRRGYNPVDEENRIDFFDSLYHAAAVVGINTSAMIEAAIVGRPVFSMLAAEFSGTQEGTIHFHHLLPENGGCVRIASTLDEHVAQLGERLKDPAAAHAETQRFVASFIRPHGIDRAATPIFADAVERLAGLERRPQATMPAWGVAVRPLLVATSGVAAGVGLLMNPERLARAARQARKKASKRLREINKQRRKLGLAEALVRTVKRS
jgi:hypothetical protein